jgi:hypothetical protein
MHIGTCGEAAPRSEILTHSDFAKFTLFRHVLILKIFYTVSKISEQLNAFECRHEQTDRSFMSIEFFCMADHHALI